MRSEVLLMMLWCLAGLLPAVLDARPRQPVLDDSPPPLNPSGDQLLPDPPLRDKRRDQLLPDPPTRDKRRDQLLPDPRPRDKRLPRPSSREQILTLSPSMEKKSRSKTFSRVSTSRKIVEHTSIRRGSRLEPHLTNRLPDTVPGGLAPGHNTGMVPSPSDHLPVQDLIEIPNKQFDPRPQDLNPRRLKKLLGAHYNSNYMSIVESNELGTNMFETVRKDLKFRPKLSRDLRQLDRTVLAGGYQLRMKLRKSQRRKVKRFLQAYSHCPVQHRWKDLGVRFWPRWIKESRCYQGRSCSIPQGMSCQPHESTNLTLLRWFCPAWDKRRRCSWIQIQYPIVTSCKCAC